jgi:RNA polymerase sigma-70 factor (ECF subfamily)
MEAVAATAPPADEALAARTRAGEQAFTALYAPHFEAVYDYVLRVVGDRATAADVVRETFARAAHAFPEQGSDIAAWLFTTARTSALEALRYRRDRKGDVREALQLTRVDADRAPDAEVVFDRELVELVCEAAASLSREEYSVFALEVRHDFAAAEIGAQLGSNGAVSIRLTRTRDAFDESVGCQLVSRRGRHNCTELDILTREDAGRRVTQHIQRCARCQTSMRRFVSPTEVLGALAFVEPPRDLRREIFGRSRRSRIFGIL